jgi:uncharacterized protein YcbX
LLSVAPVKSLRLVSVDAVELEATGVRGDRRFYLVDEDGALVSTKRVPVALTVRPAVDSDHTGSRDLDTLDVIAAYRGDVPSTEPLPFGVWCGVVEAGPVAVGDPVAVA